MKMPLPGLLSGIRKANLPGAGLRSSVGLEHFAVNEGVPGSSPGAGATKSEGPLFKSGSGSHLSTPLTLRKRKHPAPFGKGGSVRRQIQVQERARVVTSERIRAHGRAT